MVWHGWQEHHRPALELRGKISGSPSKISDCRVRRFDSSWTSWVPRWSDERRKPRVRPHRYGERAVDAPRAKTRATRLPTNVTLRQRPTSTHAARHRSSAHTNMAVSIFQRKRDLIYLIFFLVHLPVMLGTYREGIVRLEALPCCNSIAKLHIR